MGRWGEPAEQGPAAAFDQVDFPATLVVGGQAQGREQVGRAGNLQCLQLVGEPDQLVEAPPTLVARRHEAVPAAALVPHRERWGLARLQGVERLPVASSAVRVRTQHDDSIALDESRR